MTPKEIILYEDGNYYKVDFRGISDKLIIISKSKRISDYQLYKQDYEDV